MPVPPYDLFDIPGSDTASKLIVNQPNGNTEVTITGVMNGLTPNTTYTVYLSKGYTPYTPRTITEIWEWNVLNSSYIHQMTTEIVNSDGTFSGTDFWPLSKVLEPTYPYTEEIFTEVLAGNQMTFTVTYQGPYAEGSQYTVTGDIQSNGSVIRNTPWHWETSPGTVIPEDGSKGWPGLFTDTVPPFTFVTDDYGMANWHINLTEEDSGVGTNKISIWINRGGTLLISDPFEVTFE